MFEERGGGPELVEVSGPAERACRCGTKIPAQRRSLAVRNAPESVMRLLRDARFCSLPCVRAYFLEELARQETDATPADPQVLDDFRWTYLSLAGEFGRIVDVWARRLRDEAASRFGPGEGPRFTSGR